MVFPTFVHNIISPKKAILRNLSAIKAFVILTIYIIILLIVIKY